MALNPPINADGQPMRVEGELFAVLRKDMEIEVKIQGWAKQSAKGKLFVTTARLVFVNDNHNKDTFKSFDVPLLNIFDEKFEQPIFGANYLSLKVKPLFGLIPGDATVKIWFMSGGCQKFLDIFLQVLPQIRKRKNEGADPRFESDITNGNLSNKYAYVDPSDPSYVFVSQPNVASNNSQMNQYYANFPEASPNLNYAPPSQDVHNPSGHGANVNANVYNGGQPSSQHGFQQPHGGQQGGFQQQNQGFSQGGFQPINQPNGQNQQGGYPQFDSSNQYQGQTYNGQPQNPGHQQVQGNQQAQPQYEYHQQQQPNVGYYYGYWGPNLQRNQPQ